jgi:hypothetical protein
MGGVNDVGEHVAGLLALRAKSGELVYRRQVMRLLGAEPFPGLPEPDRRIKVRRAEGSVSVVEPDGRRVEGLVCFAVGLSGAGVQQDVASKDGGASAKSLLADSGKDFVLLVTTGHPPDAVVERAAQRSGGTFVLGGTERPRVWVMGLPEVVARGEAVVASVPAPVAVPWWRSLLGLFRGDADARGPVSPLLAPQPS